jgi:hypothetical protein
MTPEQQAYLHDILDAAPGAGGTPPDCGWKSLVRLQASIRVISVIRGQTSVAAEPRWVIRGKKSRK